MPVPALRDVITPTSRANGLPAATLNERFLLTLAMLATGTAPDGTTLPGGGARIVLGPLTLTATGTVSGLPTLFGTASLPLGPLTTTATGSVPASGPPVAGYVAWYDASQITGPPADNTALAIWNDLSANHYDLTQATPAQRPTYYSSTSGKLVNGKPAVWFNSTVQNWLTWSGANIPFQTIFVVGAPGGAQEPFVAAAGSGPELRVSSGKLQLIDQAVLLIAASTGTVANVPTVSFLGSTYDGVSCALYINSATPDSTTSITHTMPTPTGIQLGLGAGDVLNGPLCEVIGYPSVLTGPQITATYTYLKTKWGTP